MPGRDHLDSPAECHPEQPALSAAKGSVGAAGAKSKDPWVCGGKRSFDCAHFVGFAQDDTPGSGALHLPPLM